MVGSTEPPQIFLTDELKLMNNHPVMARPIFSQRASLSILLGFACLLVSLSGKRAFTQQPAATTGGLSEAEAARIIKAFTSKETQFRRALNSYAFKRDALLQTLGMGGQVTGEYHRVSFFTFDDKGGRYEKISLFPLSNLSGVVTPEDLDDLGGINPFALEPSMIDRYNFKYVGKEKIDELNLYVFDVTPKVIPDPKKTRERLFTGRVWVDDQELQIVKTRGKGVPETKVNKFPYVETYREQIDGRYWFPTYSYADEELIYDSGESLHIRMKVRYSDFQPARSTVTITELDKPEALPQSLPSPQPPSGPVIGPSTTAGEPSATPVEPSTTAINPSPTAAKPVGGNQKVIQGGILNSLAVELPEPEFPEAARRAGMGGKVIVSVVVDENGKVISAEIEDGRIEFRRVALEAARKARFRPTLLAGQPVKMSGVLEYIFAP